VAAVELLEQSQLHPLDVGGGAADEVGDRLGAGVRPGIVYGRTDELGGTVAENQVHVHDFHATILHLLGFDHERLTFRHAGRDFRLTDVAGKVVKDILV
jgi:hypothetical protein